MSPYDCVISIVIYNQDLNILSKAISSVLHTKLKILINIVDNSEQPCLDENYINNFKKQDNLVKLNYIFNNNNLGFGTAHNLTIKQYHSQTKYFLILNPDIEYNSQIDTLAILKTRLDKDPSISLAIPKILSPDGSIQYVNKKLPTPSDLLLKVISKYNKFIKKIFTNRINQYLLKNLDYNKNIICPAISGCFMFVRSDILYKIGGFDERYFLYMEDTDLSYSIAKQYKTVVFNDIAVTHVWQRGAYKKIKLFWQLLKSGIKYFNKWGWFIDKNRKELNNNISYYES